MSATLSPTKIALAALRQVRNVSWFQTGGEGPALSIALERLDMIMAELAGTERLWWLVDTDVEVAISAGTQDYNLAGILNPDAQDVLRAAWMTTEGKRQPLCLYRLIEWDGLEDRGYATGSGPEGIYVEHTPASVMHLYKIPTVDGTIALTMQTMATSIDNASGDPHGAPTAWQRYFVLALSADIGAGPIERLSEAEINRLKADANMALIKLLARNRKENVHRPRMVRPWDVTQ